MQIARPRQADAIIHLMHGRSRLHAKEQKIKMFLSMTKAVKCDIGYKISKSVTSAEALRNVFPAFNKLEQCTQNWLDEIAFPAFIFLHSMAKAHFDNECNFLRLRLFHNEIKFFFLLLFESESDLGLDKEMHLKRTTKSISRLPLKRPRLGNYFSCGARRAKWNVRECWVRFIPVRGLFEKYCFINECMKSRIF